MNTPIICDTATARTIRGEAAGAPYARPDHRDDAPAPGFRTSGTFTQQELRDLVLHWMG